MQLIGKMQELIKVVNESEKTYVTFPGAAMKLEQKIKQLDSFQFQSKVFDRNLKKVGEEANIELTKLRNVLTQREEEMTSLKEQMNVLSKSKDYYEKLTHSLQEQLKEEKNQSKINLENIKTSLKTETEFEVKKYYEENLKLKEQLFMSNSNVKKLQELEELYQHKISLLKEELSNALNRFTNLEKELYSTGNLHNVY